ncbi:MAG: Manganese catalase, partial [uncultured Quadrisphaera sp.]
VLPQAGAPVQGLPGQARRAPGAPHAGAAGRAVRRDHRRDAVHVPGLEHPRARQVPRHDLRHRRRGGRPRRDAGRHDRPAAREGAGGAGRGRHLPRPGGRRRHRRHGRPARDRRRGGRPPRGQHGQPVVRLVRHRERQPARRLPRQRGGGDAGSGAGDPGLPRHRRQGRPRPAQLHDRARHHAPEPVAGRCRRAAGRGPRGAPRAEQLPAEARGLLGRAPVPELLRRPAGSRGQLGQRARTGRQGPVQLHRRPAGPRRRAAAPAHHAGPPVLRHDGQAEPRREGRRDGQGRPV